MENSIEQLRGIGEKKAKLFNKLGIFTILDIIEYYPRDYKDRSEITKISEAKLGESCTFLCRIKQKPENIRIKGLFITKTIICDETGALEVAWMNMPYLKNSLEQGVTYFFVGKVVNRFGKKTIQNPEFEKWSEEQSLSYNRIVPVYTLVKGLTQKALRTAIHEALEQYGDIPEILPKWILQDFDLYEKHKAVKNIHFPETNKAFLKSRERLCFDELFILQAALYKFKHKKLKETKGFIADSEIDCNLELPFSLTQAQQKVLEEIEADMKSGISMNRLIQGDVGSGKTIVAFIAAYWAVKNGYQATLMAPTEVLAGQHFEAAKKILPIHTVMLNGSMTKKEKALALSEIASGKADMIIGTHAVIQKAVIFSNLGLVITDEQHRFGVKQREALTDKGETPHSIVMTATPIPRTLALILYGDLDISIIDALPPGRQEIDTFAVGDAYRQRIYTFIEKEVLNGRQVYIICSAIESKEENRLELLYLQEYVRELKTQVFSKYRVEALHGKMKAQEKQEIMEAFSKNEINILVSTTVIEVGINVPNATIMLVENAERFGLSQLHQLRGRVGRGSHKSYCILMSNSENDIVKQRMETMTKTADGFKIAEMDLKLRGSGDFFGTRQHGLPEMRIANLFKDIEILKKASDCAEKLINQDPYLEDAENKGIQIQIDNMFKDIKFGINL